MKTKILKISVNSSDYVQSEEFSQCVSDVKAGALVIFPTETVYGLGAVIDNEEALRKIYMAKGRPSDNPLIVHIANMKQLERVIEKDPPEIFGKLAHIFWPGPVTFILKKNRAISQIITGNRSTVAVRFPSNKIAQSLINQCEVPIAAPSANLSGTPSPTRAEHLKEMKGRVEWIIETEPLEFGLESTIISLVESEPLLLRPGPVTMERLMDFIPNLRVNKDLSQARAPGMKYRHYSPKASVIVLDWDKNTSQMVKKAIETFKKLEKENTDKKMILICTDETQGEYSKASIDSLSLGSKHDLYRVASNLFHFLRMLDEKHIDIALVEGFEEKGLGITIMNRLNKAALS